MRRSTAAISAVLLLSLSDNQSLVTVTDAFGLRPSSTSSSTSTRHHRRQTTTTRLGLLDPILVESAAAAATVMVGSSSSSSPLLLAYSEVAEALGSLALLGSLGFGVFGGMRDPNFHYEYKVGNDGTFVGGGGGVASDLALLEVSPFPLLEEVEESTSAVPEPAPEEAAVAAVVAEVAPPVVVAAKAKAPPAVKPPPVVPEPARATAPSAGILESTEKAKEVVQKAGVKETKERMSSRGASSPSSSSSSSVGSSTPAKPPAAAAEQKKAEVAVITEKKDGSRGGKVAKGITLIAAAGLVALVRNVVKAYLGRGLL